MNFDLVFRILELAMILLQSHSRGNGISQAEIAGALTEIITTAHQAYKDHFGYPLDPAVIKAEAQI